MPTKSKALPEVKITVIDGQRALYRPAPSILPPSMETLLRVLRNAKVLTPIRFAGYRSACLDEHRLVPWVRGYFGLRELLVSRCADCGMAEVRDVSIDRISGLPTGRLALRRRSELLGWFSGARALGRVYL